MLEKQQLHNWCLVDWQADFVVSPGQAGIMSVSNRATPGSLYCQGQWCHYRLYANYAFNMVHVKNCHLCQKKGPHRTHRLELHSWILKKQFIILIILFCHLCASLPLRSDWGRISWLAGQTYSVFGSNSFIERVFEKGYVQRAPALLWLGLR